VTDVHVDYPRLVELLERWRVSPGFLPSVGALYIHRLVDAKMGQTHFNTPGLVPALAAKGAHAQRIQAFALTEANTVPRKIRRDLRDLGIEVFIYEDVEEDTSS
jgi:hypothetical protein